MQSARDLGVTLDSQLSLFDHIAAICRASFYQLRQIRPAIQSLTYDDAKTIVQVFIACRLDWCNSLLCGVPANLLRKLQSVQNAAARILTNTLRRDHITPVLRQLHWLPVCRDEWSSRLRVLYTDRSLQRRRPNVSCLRAWSPSPLIFILVRPSKPRFWVKRAFASA